MRVALKKMLVFSLKTSWFSGSLPRSTVIGPVCRQATEKFDGSSLSPSVWPQPPLRACEMWQVTPGTLGSSKSTTQTLSFGDKRLNVVLMQPRLSALAIPDKARKTQAERQNSFKCSLPSPPARPPRESHFASTRLFSSPLGERRGPIASAMGRRGGFPPLHLLPTTARKLRFPLTLPRLRRGSLPLPEGGRGFGRFGQIGLSSLAAPR